jgi:hypothetical protein
MFLRIVVGKNKKSGFVSMFCSLMKMKSCQTVSFCISVNINFCKIDFKMFVKSLRNSKPMFEGSVANLTS